MFFDIHAHMCKNQRLTETGEALIATAEQMTKRHKELNIVGAVVLQISNSELQFYQPVEEVVNIAKESNGAYVPFCTVDPRTIDSTTDLIIGKILENCVKLGCKGVGEVMANLEWLDPKMQNLLSCAQSLELPLLFDMTGRKGDGYGIYDEAGMPQLEKCLERYPSLNFIAHGPAFWAEISELQNPDDRFTFPKYPVISEGRIAKLMRAYPNLWVDLSAGSGANAMLRDMVYAGKFMREFHERILFGTDICDCDKIVPQPKILFDLLEDGSITKEMFDNIAYRNAYRLLKISIKTTSSTGGLLHP